MGIAICGGSNLKAPMKSDFLRRLQSTSPAMWPSVLLVRGEGGQALCFEDDAASANRMNCIGLVSAPDESLLALLRAGTVKACVTALCLPGGSPCAADSPDAWGFFAEYDLSDGLSEAVSSALQTAVRERRGSEAALREKLRYLQEQAVPENVILRLLENICPDPTWPDMVPDPPVRFVQEHAMGELTRALAYRLTGLHLRLIGNKGSGKNTLLQTIDWLMNLPQYRMQGSAELDKLDLLGGPTVENGTMRYVLSDMLLYLQEGADVVLDEGNTIKPECIDVLHSLTDAARCIQVPGYGPVRLAPCSAFAMTMNEDYAGTNYMNEATIDRFTPLHMRQPDSILEILRRVVPEAPEDSLRTCDALYTVIRDMTRDADGLEPEAMTIRGIIGALRAEPLLGLKLGLLDNVAGRPQDLYTRLQLTELIEGAVR